MLVGISSKLTGEDEYTYSIECRAEKDSDSFFGDFKVPVFCNIETATFFSPQDIQVRFHWHSIEYTGSSQNLDKVKAFVEGNKELLEELLGQPYREVEVNLE